MSVSGIHLHLFYSRAGVQTGGMNICLSTLSHAPYSACKTLSFPLSFSNAPFLCDNSISFPLRDVTTLPPVFCVHISLCK